MRPARRRNASGVQGQPEGRLPTISQPGCKGARPDLRRPSSWARLRLRQAPDNRLNGSVVLNVELADFAHLLRAPPHDVTDLLIRQAELDEPRGVSAAHVVEVLPATVGVADVERIAHHIEAMAEPVLAPALAAAVDEEGCNAGCAGTSFEPIEQGAQFRRYRNDGALAPPSALERHALDAECLDFSPSEPDEVGTAQPRRRREAHSVGNVQRCRRAEAFDLLPVPDDLRTVAWAVKAWDARRDVRRDPAVKAAPGKHVMKNRQAMVGGPGLMRALVPPGENRLQLARVGPEGDGCFAPSDTDFLHDESPYIAGPIGELRPFRAGEVGVDEVGEGGGILTILFGRERRGRSCDQWREPIRSYVGEGEGIFFKHGGSRLIGANRHTLESRPKSSDFTLDLNPNDRTEMSDAEHFCFALAQASAIALLYAAQANSKRIWQVEG